MTGNGLQFPIRVKVTLRGCRHCQLPREPISKTAPPKANVREGRLRWRPVLCMRIHGSCEKISKNQKCYVERGWSPMTNNEVMRYSLAWQGAELLMLAAEPATDSH